MGNGKWEMEMGNRRWPLRIPISHFPCPISHFPFPISQSVFIASFAALIVAVTSRSVCAPERNHASYCDGGG
jgi:hypothetical protein